MHQFNLSLKAPTHAFRVLFNDNPVVDLSGRDNPKLNGSFAVGAPGPSGSSFGFHVIRDGEYDSVTPQTIPGDTRTLLENDGLGSNIDFRLPPYDTHDFLVNDRFYPLTVGSVYTLRLTCVVESTVMNNEATFELDIGGAVGRIQGVSPPISRSAGVSQQIEMLFKMFALDTFLANGGGFYVTTLSELMVHNVEWFITPDGQQ